MMKYRKLSGLVSDKENLSQFSGILIWVYLDTDNRKKIQFSVNYQSYVRDHKTGYNHSTNFGIRVQLSDALNISMYPGYSKRYDEIEWVETLDDLEEARYIRGSLNQTTTSMTIRINFNITPDFTIQYYGMPFISAGEYTEFKYIHNPGADDFNNRFMLYSDEQLYYNANEEVYEIDETINGTIDYTFDQPNFNVFDFNSNLVVRWEYLPGSVVYFVWTQNRSETQNMGNFNLGEGIKTLFLDTYPRDVFLIKLSYRFGL